MEITRHIYCYHIFYFPYLVMKNIYLFLVLFASSLCAAPAPDFTITTSDGVQRKLYADYVNQGKALVIEIFFIACPPCNSHAPHFQNLYTQMKAQYPGQVEFLLLSRLTTDNNAAVSQYLASKNMTMPGAGGDGGGYQAVQPYVTNQYGPFYGTPTFLVIAPFTGEVTWDVRGVTAANTMQLLQQAIAAALPKPCTIKNHRDSSVDSVFLRVQTPSLDSTLLVKNGSYSLTAIPALRNTTYTLTPLKNGNDLLDLTTYDLLLMSRHILTIISFSEDWQLLAGDLNCNGAITGNDVVIGRKLILGISDVLPCGSYKFLPASVTAQNGGCADFRAVKLGDVND